MGLFGKLFEKKSCDICGGEIGLLGNRKLEDGNLRSYLRGSPTDGRARSRRSEPSLTTAKQTVRKWSNSMSPGRSDSTQRYCWTRMPENSS